MLLQVARPAQGTQVAERIRIAARGQRPDMMHLFGGRCSALKQAVLAERMYLKVLLPHGAPSPAAIYLLCFGVAAITVVVPVLFGFVLEAVLSALNGELRTARVTARPFRFSRHNKFT